MHGCAAQGPQDRSQRRDSDSPELEIATSLRGGKRTDVGRCAANACNSIFDLSWSIQPRYEKENPIERAGIGFDRADQATVGTGCRFAITEETRNSPRLGTLPLREKAPPTSLGARAQGAASAIRPRSYSTISMRSLDIGSMRRMPSSPASPRMRRDTSLPTEGARDKGSGCCCGHPFGDLQLHDTPRNKGFTGRTISRARCQGILKTTFARPLWMSTA